MTLNPRILMFAPLCYPPAGSEAIVTCKLVLSMVNAGWQVDVITQGDIGPDYPVKDDATWEPVQNCIISVDGISSFGKLPRFLSRFRPILWSLKSSMLGARLLRARRYDAIFSRVAPQFGHLPALFLSFFFTTPWCAAWSDPMPPQKAPFPYGEGQGAPVSWPLNLYWRLVVSRAQWHVFPCDRLRRYVSGYFATGTRTSAIPHVAMGVSTRAAASTKTFTLCFAGSLTGRNPVAFLKGLRLFLDRHPEVGDLEAIFISNGLEEVRSLTAELNLGAAVKLYPEKAYLDTLAVMSVSNVLLVIEAACEEGIFFPSKFIDFVQLGRPILALSPCNGTLFDILLKHGGGIAVDVTSVEGSASALASLYAAWKAGRLDDLYGSSRLMPLFCSETVLKSYREIMDNFRLRSAPSRQASH